MASGHTILGVISDTPAIASWCAEHRIRLVPQKSDYTTVLAERPFDYLLSITNLTIVPAGALKLPRRGAVNFHDGPLPSFGGLYSPAWALMAGEREHGITWHRMTDAVDEGDIVLQRRFPVADGETSLTLNTRCFEAGVESFPELVRLLAASDVPSAKHALEKHTYHGLGDRPKALAVLDWQRPAAELAALVRALDFGQYPNPLALPKISGSSGVVLAGMLHAVEESSATPGTVLGAEGDILRVAATDGALALTKLMSPDGRSLTGADALRALGGSVGAVLPAFDASAAAELDAFTARAARFAGFWVERLSSLVPLDLPYAERVTADPPRYELHDLPLAADRDATVRAFALFLARLSGRTAFDLGFREVGPDEASETFSRIVAPRVPFRVALDTSASTAVAHTSLARELELVRKRVGFARDEVARRPALKGLAGREFALPVGVELVESFADRLPPQGDLTLVIARDGRCCWVFDASVLAEQQIAAMARQFAAVVAADAETEWTAIPLLTADQSRQVLREWNGQPVPVDPEQTVSRLIEAQVARTPDAIAAVFEDSHLTYSELDARANQLARHLRTLGAGPDTLVGLCCERSLDMMVALLGIHKAGAAYVPMDSAYPPDRLALMLDDAQVQILVTQESVLGELPDSRATVVCVDRDWPLIGTLDAAPFASGATGANLAYCIYTSGSTGRPKGVLVEHRNVVNFFAAMDLRLGTEPGTWLAVTSLSFDISVLELLWTLTRGYKVVLYADENRAASRALDLANQHKGVGFSLFYFSANENENARDRYRILMEGARFGDKHGFTAVWTPERHFHAFGGLYPNPSVTGAAVAAVTTRIGVRAGSCVLPLHHPVRVVEEWSVVDNLSNGRVGVSVAAGWQPNDFVLMPENYADSKKKTVDMIDTVRRLWRGETLTFPGPRGDVAVRTLPRPVQPELPLWFTTAGNPESYEIAGTLGVNVLTHLLGQSVDELADKITLYRKARKAAGHKGDGQISLMLHTFVGDDDAEVKAVVKAPMKAYLATSISLIKGYAAAFPTFKKGKDGKTPELDFQSLSTEEMDALLDYSFERYYESSGLFGTVETCAAFVDRLKGIGVDEIACLVDFGVESELVLRHLPFLNRLRTLTSRARTAFADYSIAAQIGRHHVTHLQCTPSMAGMIVSNDRSRDALRSLRTVCVGGEAFPPALATELQRLVPGDVHNMYGPTETTIWSSMHTLDGTAGPVPLGTPLANNELYVLDSFQQPVPPGVPGELYIGGRSVVRGYWRRPELTAERFVPNPFRRDPTARMYRTGDLVRWRDNGILEFLGRVDFQVKIRGYRIELGEIEAALTAMPSVREAVVVARDEGGGDKRLVAYVVWREAPPEGVSGLRAHLRSLLPEFMVPSNFIVLRDLPRTPNAKIDRNALPAPESVDPVVVPAAAPVAPAGQLEGIIAGIWREVLKVPAVGVEDNFFDLGGHSLLAVQVHSRLRKSLERDLSITDLFRFPTIRGLAGYLGGEVDHATVQSGLNRAAQRRDMAARRLRRPTT
ncbi:MupA/Atu3671 family FMN-dependent luciferase-like monooxygenase [Luteitalea sp.]|uniref:MupA/Atu3671 family FMN-dependent luciferase-like monooxygenase n=1 Tax=Luteitalea sp. TaxID=2004800 RepID=UPI0025C6EE61|nr:MupA/Atu3671 family FMN-dependent luciferase-like monooxygenase [Luteitalea sp.]